MKSSEVYRKAALSIERDEWYSWRSACEAISEVGGACWTEYTDKFNDVFCPPGVTGWKAYYFGDGSPENQNARILALCFMAAISESEGD